jgi:hypothetical protein
MAGSWWSYILFLFVKTVVFTVTTFTHNVILTVEDITAEYRIVRNIHITEKGKAIPVTGREGP